MLPTAGDVHVNAPLTNISIGYLQTDPSVADQVFPMVEVKKQSDRYYVYDFADWNRSAMQKRAPATESAGGGWSISDDTYFCEDWALHKDIDDEIRANEDAPLNMDTDAVEYLMQQRKIKSDIEFAADYFTTGLWTGSTTGTDITPGTLWDAANSTPIADIRAQIRSVKNKTGFKPNRLVMPGDVWDVLQDNADFLDRIKYTQTGVVTTELLARVLEIEKVVISELIKVTSVEGNATTTTAPVFGAGKALLAYSAPRPSKMLPSAGYRFVWNGRKGCAMGQRIKKYRMEHLDADRVEIDAYWDNKVVSPLLGAFFTGVKS